VKIGENLVDCTSYYKNNALAIMRFGVVSTKTHGGAFDIDYIRWTTEGVFAPYVPPTGTAFLVR